MWPFEPNDGVNKFLEESGKLFVTHEVRGHVLYVRAHNVRRDDFPTENVRVRPKTFDFRLIERVGAAFDAQERLMTEGGGKS